MTFFLHVSVQETFFGMKMPEKHLEYHGEAFARCYLYGKIQELISVQAGKITLELQFKEEVDS